MLNFDQHCAMLKTQHRNNNKTLETLWRMLHEFYARYMRRSESWNISFHFYLDFMNKFTQIINKTLFLSNFSLIKIQWHRNSPFSGSIYIAEHRHQHSTRRTWKPKHKFKIYFSLISTQSQQMLRAKKPNNNEYKQKQTTLVYGEGQQHILGA